MSQLSVATPRAFEVETFENSLPVLTAVAIYRGSAVGLSAGYARQLVAGDTFKGFAEATADNSSGANGAKNVQLRHKGIALLTVATADYTNPTAEGQGVYASDGNTFTLVKTSNSRIGTVHRFLATNLCMVKFEADVPTDLTTVSALNYTEVVLASDTNLTQINTVVTNVNTAITQLETKINEIIAAQK